MSATVTAPAASAGSDEHLAEPSAKARSGLAHGFGPLLRRLHFYAGVLVAPFLFMVALTGLAYAFSPQIDQLAYHDQFHVPASNAPVLPLSQQVAAAQAAVPGGTLSAVQPAIDPGATTRVEFLVADLSDKQRTVYINPYTGEVRGVLTTWFGSTPVATWLDQMHANLNLGDPGRLYSELAASWLWVLVLGGVVLWWRHQRGKRLTRRLLLPDTAAGKGVRRSRSWHATMGVWLAVVLLFLSATGLTWSQYAGANFGLLRTALNSDSIPLNTALDGATPPSGESHHSAGSDSSAADFDAIASSAAAAGLTGPVSITPGEQGQAWTVAQNDNTWPVRRDKIAVHPSTGEVIDTVRWADQPLLSKLTTLGIQAHMGVLFGLVNQIALALVALGLIAIILWGYRMWWLRRPTRCLALGTPPARGGWRRLPAGALALTAIIAIGIGWAIPLLGWTLLGFLILDAIGALLRRGTPAT